MIDEFERSYKISPIFIKLLGTFSENYISQMKLPGTHTGKKKLFQLTRLLVQMTFLSFQ